MSSVTSTSCNSTLLVSTCKAAYKGAMIGEACGWAIGAALSLGPLGHHSHYCNFRYTSEGGDCNSWYGRTITMNKWGDIILYPSVGAVLGGAAGAAIGGVIGACYNISQAVFKKNK